MLDSAVTANTAAQPMTASFHFIATVLQLMEEAYFSAFRTPMTLRQIKLISGDGKICMASMSGNSIRLASLARGMSALWVSDN